MNAGSGLAGRGYAMAFGGAIAFSGKAIIAKLLYRNGIDALAAVALRMLLAYPFFFAMAWWGGRGRQPLAPQDRVRVIVLGITGYYLASVLDFAGLQYVSASLERLLLFIYPTVVVLISAARRHAIVSRRQALAMAISYGGVLVAFGSEAAASLHAPGAQVAWGSVLVLGSAVSYAVYLVLSGETVGRIGALRLTGLASGVASALCIGQFCALRPWSAWTQFPVPIWELSILNAIVTTVLPMWMVMRAMELIGSGPTAQIGMVGPFATMLLAVWILNEPLTPAMLLGTALVLSGIALLARQRASAAPPPQTLPDD